MPAEPPTAYHRKLAEAIWQGAWREGKCGDAVPQIAAALADEGVMDPERFYASNRAIRDLEQQLAALRAKDKARDATYELLSKACSSYKQQLADLRTGDSDE